MLPAKREMREKNSLKKINGTRGQKKMREFFAKKFSRIFFRCTPINIGRDPEGVGKNTSKSGERPSILYIILNFIYFKKILCIAKSSLGSVNNLFAPKMLSPLFSIT